jgi:hypothetical protein
MLVSGPRNIQFLGPENLEMGQFLFKGIFLVAIELVHNPQLVQTGFSSFSIGQNSGKNYLDQKLTKCVSFWPQKLTLWARETVCTHPA